MQINNRINEVITALKISKNQFGENIGISSSLIYQITTKKNNFRVNILLRTFVAYPNLNLYWLLTGTGEMFTSRAALTPDPRPSGAVNSQPAGEVAELLTSFAALTLAANHYREKLQAEHGLTAPALETILQVYELPKLAGQTISIELTTNGTSRQIFNQ